MKKIILFIAMVLISASCKTPKTMTSTYSRDTVIVQEVLKIVEVPGASIYSPSINIDSLVELIKKDVPLYTINETLIREDPETNLRVQILIDELGNLSAYCVQQDRLIEMQTEEITKLKTITELKTITVKRTWWDTLKDVSIYLLIGFVIGATILNLKK
jgi:uncharacterized membrane protein YraQ (UPF0718 family)